ncbi:MAG: hypothetical protein ACLT98_03850 [Eggerthellaceae bacterium]
MNTAFVSLSVVCIMLFFSLTVFSTGMGLARAFSGNVEEGTLRRHAHGERVPTRAASTTKRRSRA